MTVAESPTHAEQTERAPDAGSDGSAPVRYGLVGGAVAVLLSVLPFSTAIGGAVAGYLTGEDRRAGTGAGLIAGLVAFVPYTIAGSLVVLSANVTVPGIALVPEVVVPVVIGWAIVYVLALSALGGLVGSYVNTAR